MDKKEVFVKGRLNMVMKENNETKRKKIILEVILVSIVVLSIAGTYAFFTSSINNDRNLTATMKTGTMALTFEDNDNGINKKLTFGQSVTKRFKIINTGTLDASLSLDWKNLTNTYSNGSLSYNITYSTSQDGEYSELVSETNLPVTKAALTQTMVSEISVPAGETYYYNLNITLNNLEDVNQADDLDAIFNTEFDIGQPLQYRYYNLSIDPNGGTWKEFISTQNYLLKHEEEMEIPNPTKIGYNFDGWKIEGASSVLSGIKFNMGISDTKLTAQWSLKKIKVTIDGVETEVNYGESIELGTREKEGNTFIGWSATGGTLEGNTLIVNEEKEITVTPIFKANKYKYIVYHHKMNVDGNGYTLVEADTYEEEIDHGTTVTPEVKTYEGFTSPEVQSLTIVKEDEYPPVNNVINYYYERNKYDLVIDPTGGNYDGETTSTIISLYYEESIVLKVPTREYLEFSYWDCFGGTVKDGVFTMGAKNASVDANWREKSVKVTFNSNGGVFKPLGCTDVEVTFLNFMTFGELPTPVYPSDTNFPNVDVYPQYDFMGWYTELNDGELITEDTEVMLDKDTVLYARWKDSSAVTLEALNILEFYHGMTDLKPEDLVNYKPNFALTSPISQRYESVRSNDTVTLGTPQGTRYYIYSNTFRFDEATGRYYLENPQITSQRGSLKDKYTVDIYGFKKYPNLNDPNLDFGIDEWSQSPVIYQVVSRASSSSTSYLAAYTYTSQAISQSFVVRNEEPRLIPQGLFKMDDNYGTSYYYRGDAANNYVKFGKWSEELYRGYLSSSDKSSYNDYSSLSECQRASIYNTGCEISPIAGMDMYWRIIRINGDGSLRLIYDGTAAHMNGDDSRDRVAFMSAWYDIPNNNSRELSWYSNSHLQDKLNAWYAHNIKSFNYMSDTGFCVDRRYAGAYGIDVNETLYGGFARFKTDEYIWRTRNINPQFDCDVGDVFTLMDSIEWTEPLPPDFRPGTAKSNKYYGNGELAYPVGLISADEIVAAGGLGEVPNKYYYLNKGVPYWSMTPYGVQPSRMSSAYSQPIVFGVSATGELGGFTVNSANNGTSPVRGVAPVINISAVTARKLSGRGTRYDPYYLS